ncbi:helix-turn-helix domain-containing protein [Pseudomonas nicosulfuronedens]|uniref:S24 family peptidase n=1 Tax=Pseudomonas nicosulfuronedens TaxID=2571105 RepID=UPI002448F863|nr:S24 family peptidase [Pseudomonas nicosulfuronedens]MDH1009978.1 helix-turn-helix domain-containing protein [Pseudomonas nicosulfuronedens]MDH1978954.1 helix-turn-helix domain-containing protein [Pseudomonas nicosulfuronedens]MDH2028367.1 helix-turn-helix domain-containing protein [Pseudomonas nicosulfuronedens]
MMFSILNMDFSDRVKERMKALQIGSAELAQLVGVSKGSVTHWTNGTNQAGGKRLIALANALECTAEWLATGGNDAPAPQASRPEDQPGALSVPAKTAAASMVLDMLKLHAGKSLNSAAQQRIAKAVADSLTEQHISAARPSNVITADFSRAARMKDGDIFIPQYDVRGSMGDGQIVADHIEFVRNIVVNGAQLERLGVDYTAPENLSIITGWGHSMAPTINDKDPVVVDRGVTDFIGEGIYVVIWQEHLYIKRLQMFDATQIELISDNKKHKDRIVPLDDITIQAKVVYIWNGTRA